MSCGQLEMEVRVLNRLARRIGFAYYVADWPSVDLAYCGIGLAYLELV